jgi:hypothetical protein
MLWQSTIGNASSSEALSIVDTGSEFNHDDNNIAQANILLEGLISPWHIFLDVKAHFKVANPQCSTFVPLIWVSGIN